MNNVKSDTKIAYLFLLPACLLLGVFVLYPLLQLIWVSMILFLAGPRCSFVGKKLKRFKGAGVRLQVSETRVSKCHFVQKTFFVTV